MDAQITNWEMATEAGVYQQVEEGLASGPMTPYIPILEEINLN